MSCSLSPQSTHEVVMEEMSCSDQTVFVRACNMGVYGIWIRNSSFHFCSDGSVFQHLNLVSLTRLKKRPATVLTEQYQQSHPTPPSKWNKALSSEKVCLLFWPIIWLKLNYFNLSNRLWLIYTHEAQKMINPNGISDSWSFIYLFWYVQFVVKSSWIDW